MGLCVSADEDRPRRASTRTSLNTRPCAGDVLFACSTDGQIRFRNSSRLASSFAGSKANGGSGSTTTPTWKRPRPKTTVPRTRGSSRMMFSAGGGQSVSGRVMLRAALTDTAGPDFLPVVQDDQVVRAADDLPVARAHGVGREEVARRVGWLAGGRGGVVDGGGDDGALLCACVFRVGGSGSQEIWGTYVYDELVQPVAFPTGA